MRVFATTMAVTAAISSAAVLLSIRSELKIIPATDREFAARLAALPSPTPTPRPSPVPSPSPSPIPLKEKPAVVKAIYFTSWSAGSQTRIREAINLIKSTELNAIVIDVKDYTGKVAFITSSPLIKKYGSEEMRIPDFPALVSRLHQEGIYVIARIAVFQDQELIKARPDLAVRDAQGMIWRDNKRLGWVDPGSRDVWEYNVEVAREAAKAGADELNFDYIRFPSDGDLNAIRYPFSDLTKKYRRQIIRDFFVFLSGSLKDTGVKLSIDLFGLSAVNRDDLGVGQYLEDALPYFDFVSPMVYPSHYASGFIGYQNPAAYPYEVIKYSLDNALSRRLAFLQPATTSTSTLPVEEPARHAAEIRPWLQAFDLGAIYDAAMIRKEKQAVYDAGVTAGWFLWNPSNYYRSAALEKE